MSSKAWRPIWIMTLMSLVCMGAVLVTLRAFAQNTPETKPATPATQNAPAPKEETATIEDDPTVAPDPSESADNNVTFPVDI